MEMIGQGGWIAVSKNNRAYLMGRGTTDPPCLLRHKAS